MPVATLETERMSLRALRLEDAERLYPLYKSEDFVRYLAERPSSAAAMTETVRSRLAEEKPPGMGNWTWLDRATGAYIGRGGIWPSIVLADAPIEMGWFLAADRWGAGLATEAVRAQLDYSFQDLDIPAVWATIHVDNAASLRLADRFGFVRRGEAVLRTGVHFTLCLERS
jgi:RimJ/RimL family protein N-acetyltransferase